MKRNKSIDEVVANVTNLILEDTDDDNILEEIVCVTEQIKWNSYPTYEDRLQAFSTFATYSTEELIEIRARVYNNLIAELEKDELTFVQIFRVAVACSNMFYCRRTKINNPKYKFAKELWDICARAKAFPEDGIKIIRLLDEIKN